VLDCAELVNNERKERQSVKNAIGSISKYHAIVTSAPNTGTSASMSQQNTTKRHRKESGVEANLIIATKHKRTTPTFFLLTKGR
jgi:hypothetical protein